MAAAVDSPDAVAMLEDTRNRAPLVGMVISVILAMVSLVIISSFLSEIPDSPGPARLSTADGAS